MTLSLVAAFIPVLFMSGMLGRLLREFSVTICVAILVSGFISLSLTPMLCSRYLRPPSEEKHGRLYRFLGRCLDAMNKGYEISLRWVMKPCDDHVRFSRRVARHRSFLRPGAKALSRARTPARF
jgi:HAE1 family hydrophobic/amphiphilic exporter-1